MNSEILRDGRDGEPVPGPMGTVVTDGFAYDTEVDSEEYKRSFASAYLSKPKPKAIFAMTLGMPEFSGVLDRPPLSVLKKKDLNDAYVPKADDFKHEVKRRAHFFMNMDEEADYHMNELKNNHPLKTRRNKIVIPQPNQWLNSNLKAWLTARPMKPNDKDIAFVRAEVKKFLEFLENESMIEAAEAAVAAPSTPKASSSVAPSTPEPPILHIPDLPVDTYSYTSVIDSDLYKRSAALTYSRLSNKPRVLITIALGMHEYKDMLDKPPFSLAKRKELIEDYIPRAEDYRFEIKRRAHLFMNSEEEVQYFLRELKQKHPLENMRGVVQTPQPAQWKIASLRQWLSARPLRPLKEDSVFISESMTRIKESLETLMDKQKVKEESSKKSAMKMPWGTGAPPDSTPGSRDDLITECINKSDVVLEAVGKQGKAQLIVNKITIINQSITGYQHDITSLRSVLTDVENRILNIRMKIIEYPEKTGEMGELLEDHKATKDATESQIKDLQDLIAASRENIAVLTKDMEEASAAVEEFVGGENQRKRKLEDTAP